MLTGGGYGLQDAPTAAPTAAPSAASLEMQKCAAILIQALWRGHRARKYVATLCAKIYTRALKRRMLKKMKRRRKMASKKTAPAWLAWALIKMKIKLRNRRVDQLREKVRGMQGLLDVMKRKDAEKSLRKKRMGKGHWTRACLVVQCWWRGCHARRKGIPMYFATDAFQAWKLSRASGGSESLPQVLVNRLPACAAKKGFDIPAEMALKVLVGGRIWRAWAMHRAKVRMKEFLARMRTFGMSDNELTEFVESCLQKEGASAGVELPSDVEDRFLCAICYGLLFRPVTTSCNHTFCKYCLVLWFEQQTIRLRQEDPAPMFDNTRSMDQECPLCRQHIIIADTMEVNRELEDELIQKYGHKTYNSRHKDIVAEKVDRLVTQNSTHMAVQRAITAEDRASELNVHVYLATQAGLFGAAVAGPLGIGVAVVTLAGLTVSREMQYIRTEERGAYGILEDEADSLQVDSIKLVNMAMIQITVNLYHQKSNIFAPGGIMKTKIASGKLEPGRAFRHEIAGRVGDSFLRDNSPARPSSSVVEQQRQQQSLDEGTFILEVTRPVMFIDKELADTVVWPGRSYLFLRVDSAVQYVGNIPEDEGDSVQQVQVQNLGSREAQLEFYKREDRLCWWPKAKVSLQPSSTEVVKPDSSEEELFKVVIKVPAVPQSHPWHFVELATVELKRGRKYTVKEPASQALPPAPAAPRPQDLEFELFDESDSESGSDAEQGEGDGRRGSLDSMLDGR